jgi:hypothetical protein
MKIKDFSEKKKIFISFHFDESSTRLILLMWFDKDKVYRHLMDRIINNYSLPN